MMLEIGVALTTERALRRSLDLMTAELPGVGVCELLPGDKHAAVILEQINPRSKQKISVGCEHEAVEAIETLMRRVADAPRLDVACSEQSGLLDPLRCRLIGSTPEGRALRKNPSVRVSRSISCLRVVSSIDVSSRMAFSTISSNVDEKSEVWVIYSTYQ